ncbi:hypothetical protein [Candidatus Cytomitobacter primus]|uniref:SPOR domain-containing protein n=1 Tax=Candidatus Cytomitobacter primus TaxID=2066024 RepID=A0A5C0UH47_9PROT|nr:hypothetical protein [Candidatus Cytomitobacter primus]QEK38364.1 hypothetical protein FZC34_00285 [Candidatus Cytomitobacter primus]
MLKVMRIMQNQILRNSLGKKLQTSPAQGIRIGFTLFFVITTFIFSGLSFASGFLFKSYLDQKQKNNIISIKQEKKTTTSPKDYEISLGSFHDKIDATDFTDKINELNAVITKTPNGYTVKLKDKLTLKDALAISETIKSEYKIITTLMKRADK